MASTPAAGAAKDSRATSAKPGELFATFHDPQAVVNEVTGANRDRFTDTPEYKVTSVQVEKL